MLAVAARKRVGVFGLHQPRPSLMLLGGGSAGRRRPDSRRIESCTPAPALSRRVAAPPAAPARAGDRRLLGVAVRLLARLAGNARHGLAVGLYPAAAACWAGVAFAVRDRLRPAASACPARLLLLFGGKLVLQVVHVVVRVVLHDRLRGLMPCRRLLCRRLLAVELKMAARITSSARAEKHKHLHVLLEHALGSSRASQFRLAWSADGLTVSAMCSLPSRVRY